MSRIELPYFNEEDRRHAAEFIAALVVAGNGNCYFSASIGNRQGSVIMIIEF